MQDLVYDCFVDFYERSPIQTKFIRVYILILLFRHVASFFLKCGRKTQNRDKQKNNINKKTKKTVTF